MKKMVIFGAGPTGKRVYEFYKDICEIIAFTDNDPKLYGIGYDGLPVISPERLSQMDYDYIVIGSVQGRDDIYGQLRGMGVDEKRIRKNFSGTTYDNEVIFQQYARELETVDGECAELGVFQGNAARIINKVFFPRKIYLFDTFSGFDTRDITEERRGNYSEAKDGMFKDTSVKRVLDKMEHPEKCIVKKGYFPETAIGIKERFAFVRMDVDLYKPTIEGLKWFGGRMAQGGIIIVHDYYTESYRGVRQAVDEYLKSEPKCKKIPAGDELSIILMGF